LATCTGIVSNVRARKIACVSPSWTVQVGGFYAPRGELSSNQTAEMAGIGRSLIFCFVLSLSVIAVVSRARFLNRNDTVANGLFGYVIDKR
jgi:hypothetical protein